MVAKRDQFPHLNFFDFHSFSGWYAYFVAVAVSYWSMIVKHGYWLGKFIKLTSSSYINFNVIRPVVQISHKFVIIH